MLTTLDLYLATAPLPEVVTYVGLAMLTIGFGPFVPGAIADHVRAYRAAR